MRWWPLSCLLEEPLRASTVLGSAASNMLLQEHGAALELMKGVKQVFDPKGILNPGKIWR